STEASTTRSQTDVRTLLTGAAADIRGLAAAHALVDALDAAVDQNGIEAALSGWAAEHIQALSTELRRVSEPRARITAPDEQTQPEGSTLLSVPVPCGDPLRLSIRV